VRAKYKRFSNTILENIMYRKKLFLCLFALATAFVCSTAEAGLFDRLRCRQKSSCSPCQPAPCNANPCYAQYVENVGYCNKFTNAHDRCECKKIMARIYCNCLQGVTGEEIADPCQVGFAMAPKIVPGTSAACLEAHIRCGNTPSCDLDFQKCMKDAVPNEGIHPSVPCK
jgi:hypothetical protein